MALAKFRPSRTVRMLAQPASETPAFVKQWALARLLVWAALDQRKGTRGKSPTVLRSRNAKHAGHLVLMALLDQEMRSETTGKNFQLLGNLFLKTGGFAACAETPSAKSILKRLNNATRDLDYAFRIVDYLCRYKIYEKNVRKHIENVEHKYDEAYFSIESAKSFVVASQVSGYGLSKISKIWERHKKSAPYIYGFYSLHAEREKPTPDEALGWLSQMAVNQKRLMQSLGMAAFAAQVLQGKARNVRSKDFKNIPRVVPAVPDFSEDELNIILSTKRDGAIA